MNLPQSELDITYMFFLDFIKDWWQHENFYLKDSNSRENAPLTMTSEKAKSTLVAKTLDQRKSELVDLLQCYLAIGDDINVKADNGERPLHAACESGQVATVQYLCDRGAVLEWQDNNGNTALHVAVCNGHLDVTRFLLEKGAILNAAGNAGSTPLHIAAKGGYLNIVQ